MADDDQEEGGAEAAAPKGKRKLIIMGGAVMLVLLLASFISWWHIFTKVFSIKKAVQHTLAFESRFWSGSDLARLYDEIAGTGSIALERIFESGFAEYLKQRRQPNAARETFDDVIRRLARRD